MKQIKTYEVLIFNDQDDIVELQTFKTKEKAIKFINDHSLYYAIFNREFTYRMQQVVQLAFIDNGKKID